jgi:DNA polymerase-1
MLTKPPLRDLLRNSDCRLCPLWEGAQSVCLIGDGIYPADLMLVGEAPGFREDNINKPFSGRAGELLDGVLEAVEVSRRSIFISNAVHCRPIDPNNPTKNGKPKPKEIEICSSTYLTKEVAAVKPKLIVAMGAIAGTGLLQEKVTVSGYRSRIWRTKEPFLPGIPVIVTYHPAAALYDDSLIEVIVKDFKWARKVMVHGHKDEKVDYRLIDSVNSIPGYDLDKLKWVSIDLETDGFDPFLPNRNIISVQLAIKTGQAFYLPWTPSVRKEIKLLAEDSRIGKIGHNVNKFDRNWLRKDGIHLRGKMHDTLIAIHLLNENFEDKSLDSVTSEYTPLKNHKHELQKYRKEHKEVQFRDIPLSLMVPYGCGDADASLRLKKVFVPKLKAEGLMPLFNMQMKAMKLFADVEWDGAKIDVQLIDVLADDFEARINRLDKKLKGLNAKSSQQVCKVLYKKWKLPAVGLGTKKSNWKPVANSAEKTLLKLMEIGLEPYQEKFIKRVLRSRELRTQLSTYILGIGDYIRKGDLIHTNYLLHGTDTGRLSSRGPNLQNIPREGPIKRLFVSRFGRRGVILSVDVSQGELRLAAHRSQDPALLAAFKSSGVDIHTKVAAMVLKIRESEVTPKQRKKAKTVNFGILYGGGAEKMAMEMKCSVKEAYEFIQLWKRTYSQWEPFTRSVKREVLLKGYVVSDFGRRRRLAITDPDSGQGREAVRQAINSPIQGGLSDYTVLCGIELKSRIRKAGIKECCFIANVHDQWVIDTLEEHAEKISEIAQDVFKNPDTSAFGFKFSVPMDIEVSMGPNWGEQTTIYPKPRH